MADTTTIWPTQQLSEFLAAVIEFPDREAALRGGLEWAAEALEAEVGAIVVRGRVMATVGWAGGAAPVEEILEAAAGQRHELAVPGIGPCRLLAANLEETESSSMLVARSVGPFDISEAALLRAMARCLVLVLRSLRILETEREVRVGAEQRASENLQLVTTLEERQRLLERLLQIQVSISRRAPIDEVLQRVVDTAAELLGDESAGLRLVDPLDPQRLTLVAASGLSAEQRASVAASPVTEGIAGRAIVSDAVVIADSEHDGSLGLRHGMRAGMAAPIHEGERVVGSIIVGTTRSDRQYAESERTVLALFASHVGMALRDARVVEEIHRLAYVDPLTALPNRLSFTRAVQARLDASAAGGAPIAVLFLDIDRFKLVNDSFGHAAGDMLLMAVAARVLGCLRSDDLAARLGGDEIAILVHDVRHPDDAELIARRVLDVLADPVELGERSIPTSASIGIAVSGPAGSAVDALLRNADLAMYRAKSAGGGRYAVYEPGMHDAISRRVTLESQLRRALERHEFSLRYQPIVELASGHIRGFEALLRWTTADGESIPPARFIPLAEELGLIAAVGRWVMTTAMERVRAWQVQYGAQRLVLSLNLSPRQLTDPDLVLDVMQALVDTEFEAGNLVLEITETALMEDVEQSDRKLRLLKTLGVQLALDDFGTGYSSLTHLRHFPIDILKIDRSFIASLTATPDGSSLARAVLAFGRALSLELVAEGIETAEQLDELLALHCDNGQGYLLAPPLTAAEASARLATAPTVAPAHHRLAGAC